jgi:hypothetical protein
MAEQSTPEVTIRIPSADRFYDDEPTIPVPYDAVVGTVDLLLVCIAQWRQEVGSEPDQETWGALMAAAGRAVGKLVQAYAETRIETGRAVRDAREERMLRLARERPST